jgi:GH18 family chitinase
MGSAYGAFIDKLEQRLGPKGKLLTAAVAQWIQGDMPDAALHTFDFVNVMSYDACGGWTGACPHSPYDQAVADLAFYVNDKQVPADRVVLGVPFYGYCWGACDAGYHLYSEILSLYPDAWQTDWIDQSGAQWSYNGEATMASKARLGASHGGVMIWELSGDASGQRSLLGVISANL